MESTDSSYPSDTFQQTPSQPRQQQPQQQEQQQQQQQQQQSSSSSFSQPSASFMSLQPSSLPPSLSSRYEQQPIYHFYPRLNILHCGGTEEVKFLDYLVGEITRNNVPFTLEYREFQVRYSENSEEEYQVRKLLLGFLCCHLVETCDLIRSFNGLHPKWFHPLP